MSKGKEMSLTEAQSKIKEKFPNWSFQILFFEKATSPIILKCLDCQKEKRFIWQSYPQFRYDFYIKEYNLIIEYNGRQHYEETNIFSFSLQENQERDKIKLEEAIQNGYYFLVIPYTHYNRIEEILQKWLNDYPKGVNNKLTIIERDTTE